MTLRQRHQELYLGHWGRCRHVKVTVQGVGTFKLMETVQAYIYTGPNVGMIADAH